MLTPAWNDLWFGCATILESSDMVDYREVADEFADERGRSPPGIACARCSLPACGWDEILVTSAGTRSGATCDLLCAHSSLHKSGAPAFRTDGAKPRACEPRAFGAGRLVVGGSAGLPDIAARRAAQRNLGDDEFVNGNVDFGTSYCRS